MNSMHNGFGGGGGYGNPYSGYVHPSALAYYNGYAPELAAGQVPGGYYGKPGPAMSGYSGMPGYGSHGMNNSMYYQQYGLGYQYNYGKYGIGPSLNPSIGYGVDLPGQNSIVPTHVGGLQAPTADLGLTGSMFSKGSSNENASLNDGNYPASPIPPKQSNAANDSLCSMPTPTLTPPSETPYNPGTPNMRNCSSSSPIEHGETQVELEKMKRCHICGQVFSLMSDCLAHIKAVHEIPMSSSSSPMPRKIQQFNQSLIPSQMQSAPQSRNSSDNPLIALERMGWGKEQNVQRSMHSSYPMPQSMHALQQKRQSELSPRKVNDYYESFNNTKVPSGKIEQGRIPSQTMFMNNNNKKKSSSYSVSSIIGDNIQGNKIQPDFYSSLTSSPNLPPILTPNSPITSTCPLPPNLSPNLPTSITNVPTSISVNSNLPPPELVPNNISNKLSLQPPLLSPSYAIHKSENYIKQNETFQNISKNQISLVNDGVSTNSLESTLKCDSDEKKIYGTDENISYNNEPLESQNKGPVENYSVQALELDIKKSESKMGSFNGTVNENLMKHCPTLKDEENLSSTNNEAAMTMVNDDSAKPQLEALRKVSDDNSSNNVLPAKLNDNVTSEINEIIDSEDQEKTNAHSDTIPKDSYKVGSLMEEKEIRDADEPVHSITEDSSSSFDANLINLNKIGAEQSDNDMGAASNCDTYSKDDPNSLSCADRESEQLSNIHKNPSVVSCETILKSNVLNNSSHAESDDQSSNSREHSISVNRNLMSEFVANDNHTNSHYSSSDGFKHVKSTNTYGSWNNDQSNYFPHFSHQATQQISNDGYTCNGSDLNISNNGCSPDSQRTQLTFSSDTPLKSPVNKRKSKKYRVGPKSKVGKFNDMNDNIKSIPHPNYLTNNTSRYSPILCLEPLESLYPDREPELAVLKPAKKLNGKPQSFVGPKRIKLAKIVHQRQLTRQKIAQEKIKENELAEQLSTDCVENTSIDHGLLENIVLKSSLLLSDTDVQEVGVIEERAANLTADMSSRKPKCDGDNSLLNKDKSPSGQNSAVKKPPRKSAFGRVLHNYNSVIVVDNEKPKRTPKLRSKDFTWLRYLKNNKFWCKDCGHGFRNEEDSADHSEELCKANCLYLIECYIDVKDIVMHSSYGNKVRTHRH